ncbi:malonyl-CoA decarboxylase [Bosea sp. TND4EK4]|uniref:malonyl-CoA decarboxylase n=1 Tax=Bosea sp. TND4EK4 TaxID=1907408 RepID=UPI000955EB0E|nr:malonyl-CoA decarboxylase [Bosea sp. TND4EK4]SIQ57982.1 malonyl-CoA decarboxylase [Bosea sp. TND4EK4]
MNRNFIQELVAGITSRSREIVGFDRFVSRGAAPDLSALAHDLLGGRGEASGVALAHDLLSGYARADASVRLAFLKTLATGFGPDPARLDPAVAAYLAEPSAENASDLNDASEPRRQELLRRLNRAPGGTEALVRMREDLLMALHEHKELGVVDRDFVHLFASWFNRGFLVLKRIDWTTSANILEKIIRYEAVHTIQSWDDLRNRLAPGDRRCFAFFHPQMGDEPLVFVEVALTKAMPDAIAPLLDLTREALPAGKATTAVFYSISNCQAGLKGVSFGNFLIKQVVEELKRELPGLSTFVTLSPVPGFMGWLKRMLETDDAERPDLDWGELARLSDPGWAARPEAENAKLREAQLRAAAFYFLQAGTRGRPVDPVARFHLGNGARLERIDWMGDLSANGLRQGGGLMVNYLYDPGAIEANHEAFVQHGTIAAASAVRKLGPAPSKAGAARQREAAATTASSAGGRG